MNRNVMIGTWAWGAGYNGSGDVFGKRYEESSLKETFEEAVRNGLTKWDTAAVYGMGSCEKLLGKFIAGHDDIFLSTKYFPNKRFRKGDLEKSFEVKSPSLVSDDCGKVSVPHFRVLDLGS